MIVATAGHVDHGKTTLVRALTGIDTDRLPEEQRRGMTIDLGFAYAAIDASGGAADAVEPIAFIDVPGHERFVRNMLAGVAAIDLGLLVVAADDGPMPQTREHLAILRLLAVPRLVVALTKADRVTPQRLAEARADVLALLAEGPQAKLADGPLAQAPVFTLAAPTGQGVAALRQHLADIARSLPARPADGPFRLAIDRSFLLAGAGRIVTGTVLSGQVRVGDELQLSPRGAVLRVRGLHAQNRAAATARAGQRCALNLAGSELKQAEPERGDWLVAPEAHAPTDRLDVHLAALASEDRALSPRATLQLHLGAASVTARVAPLAAGPAPDALAPGSSGLARLLLDRPVHAAWGDRFILRDAAANRTLAGGWVIDPAGPARGRARPERLADLAALALPEATAALRARVGLAPAGVELAAFQRSRNLTQAAAERLHADLGLHIVASPQGPLGLDDVHWQRWRHRVLAALDGWHAAHPDRLGADEATLRGLLSVANGAAAARAVLKAVLAALVNEGLLARDGLFHRRAGHEPRLAEADQRLLDRVQALLPPDELRPPIIGDLATALSLPVAELRDFANRMAQAGHLVRVAPNRFYRPATAAALATHALALAAAAEDGRFDAARYRDRTGIGRNLTVQVLEHLDRSGVTRFDGTHHRPIDR